MQNKMQLITIIIRNRIKIQPCIHQCKIHTGARGRLPVKSLPLRCILTNSSATVLCYSGTLSATEVQATSQKLQKQQQSTRVTSIRQLKKSEFRCHHVLWYCPSLMILYPTDHNLCCTKPSQKDGRLKADLAMSSTQSFLRNR